GFHLLTWKQKPEQIRGSALVQTRGRRTERVAVVPDGFFAIRWKGEVLAFCLETDMNTVNRERMLVRYRAYWRWCKDGGAARTYGPAPLRVLTMTTTPTRLATLQQLARHAPENGRTGSGLFWFAPLAVADLTDPWRLFAGPWTSALARPDPPG